jgi:GNAT superfamily N-acetyltransferase
MVRIRELDPANGDELELVATRMRKTLEEVLGQEAGRALYTMDWLRERVRFHLDPARSTAAVFVAEDAHGNIVGHSIVRLERDDAGGPMGLFSTTYVAPESRRSGIAKELLLHGEAWMRGQGVTTAVTDTSDANTKLIRLYEAQGYAIVARESGMVRLSTTFAPVKGGRRPPPD